MNTLAFSSDNAYETCYNRFLPFFLSIAQSDLIPINLPIAVVSQAMLRAAPLVVPYHDDAKKLPRFDFANVENLEPLSFGLTYANSLHSFEQSPPSELPKLVEDATSLTKTFDMDIAALVQRKFVGAAQFPPQQGPVAYRNVAFELLNRTTFLKTNWGKIDGNSGIKVDDVNHAVSLCREIQHGLAVRDLAPGITAAEVRQRAFTAAVNDYAEVRRAIRFLDEAKFETIVPSLYSLGRTAPKSSDESKAETTEAAPTNIPVSPQKTPGGPGGNPFSD